MINEFTETHSSEPCPVAAKKAPWLSIVTVTKNDPNGLARTLASAAKLRAAGAEHVVVDGSDSPSKTSELLKQYQGEVTLYSRTPRGISDAFNFGLTEVHGEWVLFLNGGDAIHDQLNIGWLHSHLNSTQAGVVTGSVQFDGEGSARPRPHLSYQWPLIACWLSHQATFVRREKLLKVDGFSQRWRIAMDYDLWLRLLRKSTVVDVISVPIARFDVTGISEHPRTRMAARREEARVVLAYSVTLAWDVALLCLRLAKRLTLAVFAAVR